MHSELQNQLRKAYDEMAVERQNRPEEDWKVKERQEFLDRLHKNGKKNLLEIGAGPGKDSLFFKDQGLKVVATDLSPEMVHLCTEKGLEAYVMDFLNLQFPDASFDAVYALNCLLHVPKLDLPKILLEIHRLMKPFGLFFMGVYGGFDHQGIWEDDYYNPKRFFSFYPDETLIDTVEKVFTVQDFKRLTFPESRSPQLAFQRLILQKD